MYLKEILYYLSWPLIIYLSYLLSTIALKKVEENESSSEEG
jgi:hypothetical protein